MKALLICPVPAEYSSCIQVLGLEDSSAVVGCPSALGRVGEWDVVALRSGPGKSRAAVAAAGGFFTFGPDVIIDSGSCGAVAAGTTVNQVVLCDTCFEYDISGGGLPVQALKEMELPSAFTFLTPRERDRLTREAVEAGTGLELVVSIGNQGCGELVVQSVEVKQLLSKLFHLLAATWETAAVFIAALRLGVAPLSARIVTDVGDENAVRDFRRNVHKSTRRLYEYLAVLFREGWMGDFLTAWDTREGSRERPLYESVLPR
jgi:adenosylhomocysteine nucleosidase